MYASETDYYHEGYATGAMTSYRHERYDPEYGGEYDRGAYEQFYSQLTLPSFSSSNNQVDRPFDNDSRALRVYRGTPFPAYRAQHDPLADLRPGPLVKGYIPEKASRSDNISSASVFVERELSSLAGKVHVLFESVRKYGRFDMKDGRILLDRGESERECYEALGRLWQIGDGYVYVRQRKLIQEERQREILTFSVYHIDHNSYVKLPAKEAAEIIAKDPAWKNDVRSFDLEFV